MMKIRLILSPILCIFWAMNAFTCLAESSGEIPKPHLKLSEVLIAVEKQFRTDLTEDYKKYEDFIIISVEYCSFDKIQKDFKNMDEDIPKKLNKGEWGWIITFAYYKANDIGFVYLVTPKKKVFLLARTM